MAGTQKTAPTGRTTLLLLCLLLLAACEGQGRRKPKSSVKPYEVVVVGDSAGAITRQLSQDEEGLPQPEPCFDVVGVRRGDDRGSCRLARAIVVFEPYKPGADSISWRQDVDAEPQIVVRTTARGIGSLRPLLDAFERKTAAETMRRKGNRRFEAMVDSMFGLRMVIPADMNACKRGNGFLWMSNNKTRGMQNLCVMRTAGAPTVERIDSCLKANIKGETDSMWMQLAKNTIRQRTTGYGNGFYGLWEMKGDAMGGPFTARVFGHQGGPDIVVLGFVYAPEMKKRNLIQQLNAVLYNKYINNGR